MWTRGVIGVLVAAMGVCQAEPLSAQEDDTFAAVVVVASAAGILTVGAYDILTAKSSARTYNERALSLAPWIELDEKRYGLSLSFAVGGPSVAERPWPGGPGLRARYSMQEAKSPRAATLWSLGATLIPAGIGVATASAGRWNDNRTTLAIGLIGIGAGAIFGPSAGHWYAERHGRAWVTTSVRAAMLVLGFLAASSLEFD